MICQKNKSLNLRKTVSVRAFQFIFLLPFIFTFPQVHSDKASSKNNKKPTVEIPSEDYGRISRGGDNRIVIDFSELSISPSNNKKGNDGGGQKKGLEAGQGSKGTACNGRGRGESCNRGGRGGTGEGPPSAIDEWRGITSANEDRIDRFLQKYEETMVNLNKFHFRKELPPLIIDVVTHAIVQRFNRTVFLKDTINKNWIDRVNLEFDKIRPIVQREIFRSPFPQLSSTQEITSLIEETTNSIKQKLYREIQHFIFDGLVVNKEKDLKELFLNLDKDWIDQAERVINGLEGDIRKVSNTPLPINGQLDPLTGQELLETIAQKEADLLNKARLLIRERVFDGYYQRTFNDGLDLLHGEVTSVTNQSVGISRLWDAQRAHHRFENNIENVVHTIFKQKYTRAELSLLGKDVFNELGEEESSYIFQSPEGPFLDKLREVHEDLIQSNPYHEQGLRARELGLATAEVADQEFASGNRQSAEVAFAIAEGLSDISLGSLPLVGSAKDFYELFSGRHLLTGRPLTPFERSLSMVGIVFSFMSGGTINSGTIRLGLKQTEKLVDKVNSTLLSKTLKGLRHHVFERVVKQYPKAILQALQSMGLKTKNGFVKGVSFLKHAFVKESPPLQEIKEVSLWIKKEDIENYYRVLNQAVPPNEQFLRQVLARQMRSTKLDYPQLSKIGKIYSNLNTKLGKEIELAPFPKPGQSGQVWRALSKFGVGDNGGKFTNTQETLFSFHTGMEPVNQRYSPKEKKAIFTSLSRRTARGEFLKQRENVKKPYIIGSKMVKFNKVLDLTDEGVTKQIGVLKRDLTLDFTKRSDAYLIPNIIRVMAERKEAEAILAPSALKNEENLKNLVILTEQ